MLHAKDILLDGEVLMGQYQAEIAQWREGEWVPMLPPVYIILTDHRLVLQLSTRKKHEPAVIPAQYITSTKTFKQEHRHGILMHIKTGQHISMFVQTRYKDEILQNIHTVIAPTAPPKKYKIELDVGSLRKIINFLGGNGKKV